MLTNCSSKGFTLIEVLIAVIVLATGLLGFAALQALTLKDSQSSYHRSVATQLAYDIADRMRANHGVAGTYTAIDPTAATAQADCKTTVGCTPAAIAENDLYEWNLALQTLPLGTGSITAAAGVYTVDIAWDDSRGGLVDLHFRMSFSL